MKPARPAASRRAPRREGPAAGLGPVASGDLATGGHDAAETFKPAEQAWMRRALALAARGRGRVEPDPMVGTVVVKDGRVIGEGFHHRFGSPHAEADALTRCSRSPRSATVYVTLEPCDHYGKTPPCTQALIAAQVHRVVAAIADPDPRVNGRGFARLRAAGIRVDVGLCADEAAELAAPFLTRVCLHRPYVILKWAQSIDGKLATNTGESRWISSEASRRRVHRLRAEVDAILVGINTVLRDDPLLTARHVAVRRVATRIVLDTHLRIRLTSALVRTAGRFPTLVLTSAAALRRRRRHAAALSHRGVEIESCKLRSSRVDVSEVLQRLARANLTRLLVEGGGQVLTSFLDAGLADEALVFLAPRLLGGDAAPTPWSGRGLSSIADSQSFRVVSLQRIGPDLCWRLRLTCPPDPRRVIASARRR